MLVAIWFIFSLFYTLIRYVYFGGVPLVELPLYLGNKVLSMFALFCFLHSMLSKKEEDRIRLGRLGGNMVFLHVILSLVLLPGAHFEKFRVLGVYKGVIGFSLLFGVLGFLASRHLMLFDHSKPWSRLNHHLYSKLWVLMVALYLFSSLHLLFMGYPGWLKVQSWHGGMPPISLLSFILCVVCLGVRLIRPGKTRG